LLSVLHEVHTHTIAKSIVNNLFPIFQSSNIVVVLKAENE